MADNDQSLYNLRYNQVTNGLEGFGGGTPMWTPLTSGSSGKVGQVVSASTETVFSTSSADFVDTNLSATITPTAIGSKIMVQVSSPVFIGTSLATVWTTIARDGSNILGANGGGECWVEAGSRAAQPCAIMYVDSPASLSPLVYSIQIKTSDGSCQFGDSSVTQSIILTEILP